MLTLVAASIVCQCLCPIVFLFTLHILLIKVYLVCTWVSRSLSDSWVILRKIEDIPGVLRISLLTWNELISKSCASRCNIILIGLIKSVGSVISGLVSIISCQSRLIGRVSCGHWGLILITLVLESLQSSRFRVCDEVLCKSGLESCLTS